MSRRRGQAATRSNVRSATTRCALLCTALYPAVAAFRAPVALRDFQFLGFLQRSAEGHVQARRRIARPQMQVDPFVTDLVLGGIAGSVSNTFVFPLDLAKTKMQQSAQSAAAGPLASLAHVVQADGISGLWAGATPVMLGSAPESAIQLAVHSWLVTSFLTIASSTGNEASLPLISQVVCGGFAGASTIVVSNPMEVLRIRASLEANASMIDNVKALGLEGLFSGWQAGLLRDVPFSALYFPLCVNLKALVLFQAQQLPEGASCTAAALVAGVVAAFVTAPLDVIKTRVQASISSKRATSAPKEIFVVAFSDDALPGMEAGARSLLEVDTCNAMIVPSVGATLQDLIKRDGLGALFRGVGPRVLRLAPCMAMTLLLYEHLHKLLE